MKKNVPNWDTIHLTKPYKDLRESLLQQLIQDGKNTPQNIDLIGTYMSFWATVEQLKWDIKERGVTVEYYTAKGDVNYKKNDNMAEMVKINGQMLRILQQLDIQTTISGEDDEL